MALLPAASHAHRPCQPALPICQATGAGADMTQSPSTEHPAPFPTQGHVFSLPHGASDFAHQHWVVQGPAPHLCGEELPLPQPVPQVRVDRLLLGSERRHQGPPKRLLSQELSTGADSLAR